MATGVGIGFVFPNITEWNEAVSVGATNIPLAIGLVLFMNWIIGQILTVCSGISFFGQLSG